MMLFGIGKYNSVKLHVMARRQGMLFLFTDNAKRVHDKERGIDRYKLKKMKEYMRPIEYENIIQNTAGNFATVYSPAKGEYYPMAITESYRDFVEVQEPAMEEYEVEEPQTLKRHGKLLYGEMREYQGKVKVIKSRQKIDKDGNPLFTTKKIEVRGLIEPINEDMKAFLVHEQRAALLRWHQQSFWQKYAYLLGPLVCGVALGLIFLFYGIALEHMSGQMGAFSQATAQLMEALRGIQTMGNPIPPLAP